VGNLTNGAARQLALMTWDRKAVRQLVFEAVGHNGSRAMRAVLPLLICSSGKVLYFAFCFVSFDCLIGFCFVLFRFVQ
jgi:hypothetical protein